MDELGRVDVLWMFPQINRVLGFVCRSGLLGRQKAAFKLPQLVAIGKNSVLVDGEGEPTVPEKVHKLESLVHREVWSDVGEPVGYITDCLFNYRSGVIVRYLMTKGRFNALTDDIYFLPPKAIKSFGAQRVLVSQEVVPTLKPYRHGLKSKLALARETVQTEYINEWREEIRSLAQQVQTFSQGALQKVERLRDRLSQETRTFVEQAKSSGQTWAERLRTESQTLGQTFAESFHEFTTRMEVERSHASDTDRHQQVMSRSAVSTDVEQVWDDQWEDELDDFDLDDELSGLDDLEELDDWSLQEAESDLASHVDERRSNDHHPSSKNPSARSPSQQVAPDASHAKTPGWQAGDDPWDDLWDDATADARIPAAPHSGTSSGEKTTAADQQTTEDPWDDPWEPGTQDIGNWDAASWHEDAASPPLTGPQPHDSEAVSQGNPVNQPSNPASPDVYETASTNTEGAKPPDANRLEGSGLASAAAQDSKSEHPSQAQPRKSDRPDNDDSWI